MFFCGVSRLFYQLTYQLTYYGEDQKASKEEYIVVETMLDRSAGISARKVNHFCFHLIILNVIKIRSRTRDRQLIPPSSIGRRGQDQELDFYPEGTCWEVKHDWLNQRWPSQKSWNCSVFIRIIPHSKYLELKIGEFSKIPIRRCRLRIKKV